MSYFSFAWWATVQWATVRWATVRTPDKHYDVYNRVLAELASRDVTEQCLWGVVGQALSEMGSYSSRGWYISDHIEWQIHNFLFF